MRGGLPARGNTAMRHPIREVRNNGKQYSYTTTASSPTRTPR